MLNERSDVIDRVSESEPPPEISNVLEVDKPMLRDKLVQKTEVELGQVLSQFSPFKACK